MLPHIRIHRNVWFNVEMSCVLLLLLFWLLWMNWMLNNMMPLWLYLHFLFSFCLLQSMHRKCLLFKMFLFVVIVWPQPCNLYIWVQHADLSQCPCSSCIKWFICRWQCSSKDVSNNDGVCYKPDEVIIHLFDMLGTASHCASLRPLTKDQRTCWRVSATFLVHWSSFGQMSILTSSKIRMGASGNQTPVRCWKSGAITTELQLFLHCIYRMMKKTDA